MQDQTSVGSILYAGGIPVVTSDASKNETYSMESIQWVFLDVCVNWNLLMCTVIC